MKHWEYHPEPVEGCFGCKGLSIQMNAGDADSRRTRPHKQWKSDLEAYNEARSQGVQPAGTTRAKVEAALKASENLGTAYNAHTMPGAEKIDKKTAGVMRELKEANIPISSKK